MKKRRLLWRVFFSSYLIAIGCLAAAILLSWVILHRAAGAWTWQRLEGAAVAASALARDCIVDAAACDRLEADLRALVQRQGLDFALVAADGTILFDSQGPGAVRDAGVSRVELGAALAGETGRHRRGSVATGEDRFHVAVPVHAEDGAVAAAMRASLPAAQHHAFVAPHAGALGLLLLSLALVSGAFLFLFARNFSRPIEAMRSGAERFGRGDLKRRIPSQDIQELGELADALNRMAQQLDQRIEEIIRQRNESEAVLASMHEGVLALDLNERILSLNSEAERLLGIRGEEVRGRLVQETLRRVELQRFIRLGLGAASEGRTEETVLESPPGRLVNVRSAPLRDGEGNVMGMVALLADVTRLHHLENLRRDFVANVSHELKTPVTSISGFAETLLDGALEDVASSRHFVEIIARQSERLGEIIEDLLSLSRLDRPEGLERDPMEPATIVRRVVDACQPVAAEAGVRLEAECEEGFKLALNETLMVQAVSNLVHNAIKYGGSGKTVRLRCAREGDSVLFSVRDEGPGIAREHHARLFERFYRVDKARSREAGGTGLGLSIVKHVAQAHRGEAEVESEVGKGSEFRIRLPL